MNLHGPFLDPEIAGDLLVQPPAQDVAEYLALPDADGVEAQAQRQLPTTLFTGLVVACDRAAHRVEQKALLGAFLDEIFRAAAHGANRGNRVGVAGQEHEW